MQELIKLISSDNSLVQSWVFLCLGAIAFAEISVLSLSGRETPSTIALARNPVKPRLNRDPLQWQNILTTSIRRAGVPAVCRAATHTAYILLLSQRISALPASLQLLDRGHILVELENFTRDMDVQGPAFAYDSVCLFVSQCLRIANQDVRLSRKHLEDKALSWLLETWNSGKRSESSLYLIQDLTYLLETVCGFTVTSNLSYQTILPRCLITDVLTQQKQTYAIRDFLLNATLPPSASSASGLSKVPEFTGNGSDMNTANPREKRISSFLGRFLESQITEMETTSHTRINAMQQSIETAVVAFLYQALLLGNNVQSDSHVLQSAARILTMCTPSLLQRKWVTSEAWSLLERLGPLVAYVGADNDHVPWTVILPPCEGSGIKKEALKNILSLPSKSIKRTNPSTLVQKFLWQKSEVRPKYLTTPSLTSFLRFSRPRMRSRPFWTPFGQC
jgi:serine-protein kinase ATM